MSRAEAAAAIGCSLDSFERYVQPDLRLVRRGRMRLVPVPGARALARGETRSGARMRTKVSPPRRFRKAGSRGRGPTEAINDRARSWGAGATVALPVPLNEAFRPNYSAAEASNPCGRRGRRRVPRFGSIPRFLAGEGGARFCPLLDAHARRLELVHFGGCTQDDVSLGSCSALASRSASSARVCVGVQHTRSADLVMARISRCTRRGCRCSGSPSVRRR
jgi:hypothetical protein